MPTEAAFKIKVIPHCPYWLHYLDGRWVLCRRAHPEISTDRNMDFIDCEYAFEKFED